MQINRPIVLTLASAFLLAGCGSSGSSGTSLSATAPVASTPGASAPAASAPAASAPAAAVTTPVSCDLVPATLVNAALGTDVSGPSQVPWTGGAIMCEYTDAKGNQMGIMIATGLTATDFTSERNSDDVGGMATKTYAGFGDQAYTYTEQVPVGKPGSNALVAREGSVELSVLSPASFAAEQTLEQQIFAKIK